MAINYSKNLPGFLFDANEYYSLQEIRSSLLKDGVSPAVLDYAFYLAFNAWPDEAGLLENWRKKNFESPHVSPYGDLP